MRDCISTININISYTLTSSLGESKYYVMNIFNKLLGFAKYSMKYEEIEEKQSFSIAYMMIINLISI